MSRFNAVYLAGRFGRRMELLGYAEALRAQGIIVTSSWLKRTAIDAISVETDIDFARSCADEDIADINNAQAMILFTDHDTTYPSKGGMHFETGYAYGTEMPMILVGPRLNVFHYLAEVTPFAEWSPAFSYLVYAQ